MESLTKFFKGFYYAAHGLTTGLSQRNLKIHFLITLLVVLFGLVLKLSIIEWLMIIICIVTVISAELFNTAVEEICNLLKVKFKLDYFDTQNPRDLAAAAVLMVALGAALIGLIIFVPKIGLLLLPTTTR